MNNNDYTDGKIILEGEGNSTSKNHIRCNNCSGIYDVLIITEGIDIQNKQYDLKCLFCDLINYNVIYKGNVSFEYIKKPKNHNAYWTLEDEIHLIEDIKHGIPIKNICEYYGRTEKAISRKLEKTVSPMLDKYRKNPKYGNQVNSNKIKGESTVLQCIGLCDIDKISDNSGKDKDFIIQILDNILAFIKAKTRNTNKNSVKAIEWLDSICNKEKIIIRHDRNGGEYIIPNTLYKADGYCSETNTIYEFLGCLYHGCNKCYDQESINEIYKVKNKTLYEKTLRRENDLKKHGYNIISIWEHDYDKSQ
ncbi:hypothetical protein QKU48_gp1326 [Fadolivirus algeromassiliense]|jgi:hypothetical protein|uniref:Uncharacterized protein n=1 Tax=Fadolivirus FV1/VV64 TaxID=3070911 RepID=A0A7D3QW22_9VIRU|nr:hypothetical protein QKU48_gp1326 [Fadolivirus algeromassiliense]QKF94784.1 hypothetical protein Fadolivirus_1_1326 [Fadolivirus FV1/VV64]